jgi:pimeloyl-ACP methyl ester carboxylesterase
VRHPEQVSRLVLAATQAGTGASLPVPPAAAAALNSPNPAVVLSVLFPADQLAAERTYAEGILQYPDYYSAPAATRAEQTLAVDQWMAGGDSAGRRIDRLRVPTLVADGMEDALDPVANDQLLHRLIPGSKLVLSPDAGHAFLFQDSAQFVPTVESWLPRNPWNGR